ncbi:MAG: VanZ family protein [Verrucomicrobiales bacterium]
MYSLWRWALQLSPAFFLTLFPLWMLSVVALSTIEGRSIPSVDIPHLDKIAHFGLFSAGGFCLARGLALARRASFPWFAWLFCVATISALGGLDEWYQTLTPGRQGLDLGDWFADSLGGLFGVTLACWLPHPERD